MDKQQMVEEVLHNMVERMVVLVVVVLDIHIQVEMEVIVKLQEVLSYH
jgi:hypothetical protein